MVNNTNNHLSPQILKNTTYDVGNPYLEQTCSGVLKVNIDPQPSHFDKWSSNNNIYKSK